MEELSNGILYKMTEVKIPTNYILTRIKSLVHYYEYLTEAEQQQYYTFMNTTKISIFEDSATPKPEILSNYYILDLNGDEEASDFWVEFPPLERYRDKDTDPYRARIMQVPWDSIVAVTRMSMFILTVIRMERLLHRMLICN